MIMSDTLLSKQYNFIVFMSFMLSKTCVEFFMLALNGYELFSFSRYQAHVTKCLLNFSLIKYQRESRQ
jgi:hypothetical protein